MPRDLGAEVPDIKVEVPELMVEVSGLGVEVGRVPWLRVGRVPWLRVGRVSHRDVTPGEGRDHAKQKMVTKWP